jgi:hypothetical protein
MLSAVAVLGSAVVTWSNGNLKAYEISLTNAAANNTNKINENLSMENIAFCTNCSGNNAKKIINVTLTNTGTTGLKITQIQVNSTTITQYYSAGTSLPVNILSQKSYTISAKLSAGTWNKGSVDTITVTTARGSIYVTQAVP